uniref:Histone acetyltransferase type B catalytic subunit n=1 Tax=Lygus hesperus TaxID=30085 RepID=A0A146LDP9_LYGHE
MPHSTTTEAVRSASDLRTEDPTSLDDPKVFHPAMSHQIFGEDEKIYGYKNLKISIYYSAAHLNIYVGVKHDETAPTCSPPNIEKLLFEKYETPYTSNLDEYEKNLDKEISFKPPGTMLKSFKLEGHVEPTSNFEIYYCTSQTPEWLDYHTRVQTFILWFIDAASYIQVDDHWKFFTLYEKYISPVSKEPQYAFVGFTTVYEYYAYPANIRPRISQMLILPPFQKQGLGAILLNSIYEHYSTVKEVLDITVEDPSNDFQYTRDYVDCCHCRKLSSFSKEMLMGRYSDVMAKEARANFKINKKQARRVYEILRLYYTNRNNEKEFTAYRLCVKKRLNALFQREVVVCKVFSHLSTGVDDEKRKSKLRTMFLDLLEDYSVVVERLKEYDWLPIAS